MKKIGFLSFGYWTPSPQSQTRSAADTLLQSIDLAVAAEELGADGAYFRVHHFARQLASPFPLLAAVGAKTSRIEIGTAVIDMRYENPFYEQVVERYLRNRGGRQSIQPGDRAALKRWLSLLREDGAIAPLVLPPLTPHERIFKEFDAYLLSAEKPDFTEYCDGPTVRCRHDSNSPVHVEASRCCWLRAVSSNNWELFTSGGVV